VAYVAWQYPHIQTNFIQFLAIGTDRGYINTKLLHRFLRESYPVKEQSTKKGKA
jgi:cellulose synthase/poly-beta-1,6-N-acetylglucosamine synthase-like glycosyltransferase